MLGLVVGAFSSDTLVAAALLIAGLGIVIAGGQLLVRGASGLARAAGLPALMIGMTVVAFGTSAPELAVNLTGALTGRGDVSFGNVVGSNIANIGLILGLAALARPLTIESMVIVREIPMMLLATAAFTVLALDTPLRGSANQFDRADGLVLLLFFSVFLYTAVATVLRRQTDPLVQGAIEAAPAETPPRVARSVLLIIAGLVGLVLGGQLAIEGAARLSELLRLPPSIIGLTIVAVGTSLPELVTSVIAALQGESDMAIGNVVGSNVFNLLLIMGATGLARPVPVPEGALPDLLALLAASLLLLPLSLSNRRTIVRTEGAVLLALWSMYVSWRLFAA